MRIAGLIVSVLGCVAACAGDAPPDPTSPSAPPSGGGDRAGSGSGGPASQTSVTATTYLERIASIQCEQAFACRSTYPGDAASFDSAWKTSVEACVANLLVAWNANAIESEIAKGRIEFDGKAAVDCLAGVSFSACDTHWQTGIVWADSCYSVMVGNVETGGTCDSLYACTSYICDVAEHRCD